MSRKSAEKEFLDFCDALYIYIHIYIVLYINYFTGKVYIYI